MKNYSFIILAAIVCLSALPSYAQDSSSAEKTVTPAVESPEVETQSEATINRQQPAPESDKCESVDR
jgi:L-fucose mutarotase/ribose pyranase (RbsD/FucU family)